MKTELITDLQDALAGVMLRDRHSLRARLRGIERAIESGRDVQQQVAKLSADVARSAARVSQRRINLPRPTYPQDLPVVERRDEIARAISESQVIVLCGETGSGKTTQLPKICLELGRGVRGLIGHTQPRRIAARSVAARLAQELESPLGQAVGYKVRFSDQLGQDSYIKLMTDGILLAETQGDRFLEAYDTIIIDEAHERSLNIDFLLGILRQLLPRRPELKLIITSATIDPERFSRHFGEAPIITVSGRVYPVELRYRPLVSPDADAEDLAMEDGIVAGIDELWRDGGPGDVLVFLSGEREIRETAERLRMHHPPDVEVLPLYSRLSTDEQMRIFARHDRRRIVLATNVAETSLTVPGIRYVIDPGLARISRYSSRSKVQRLPIERISRASANQRAGRCGRVEAGICIRLYSEQDFDARPQFTEPEILRTNLAGVILQMKALRLGEVQEFPFVEPPDYRMIRDGFQTLHELGAIDERNQLTDRGWTLSKLPIDPRIGRMIVEAANENVLPEVSVIAAALSVQDPRDRPADRQELADQAHARFRDERSDFLALLNLWREYHNQSTQLSGSALRKWCRENYLSFPRMREWQEVQHQLRLLLSEVPRERNTRRTSPAAATLRNPPPRRSDADRQFEAIHRALLSGLLSNIGSKSDTYEYNGARGTRFNIFPGSALFNRKPAWVMAGEIVETTKVYARTVAAIRPEWIERLAEHLVKRTHTDPHWNRQLGHVTAFEKVTLYGLPIVPKRAVHFGPIDPKLSRQIFIENALVEGDWSIDPPFFRHNQRLIDDVQRLEAKGRQRDVLVDARVRFDFYDARIPAGIHNVPAFEKWRKQVEHGAPKLLYMTRRDLMAHGAGHVTQEMFPDVLAVDGATLPLEYHFEPGHPADGVTVTVPLTILNQLPAEQFEWLVPGLLLEKVTALIKSLPKTLRVQFVPAPEFAQAAVDAIRPGDASLLDALAAHLARRSGTTVHASDFDPQSLLEHLHMNFRVVDESGKDIAGGRDLDKLRAQLGVQVRRRFDALPQSQFNRDGITRWDFDDLPDSIEIHRHGMAIRAYPAIVESPKDSDTVSLRLLDTPAAAASAMRGGLRKLFLLQLGGQVKQLQKSLPNIERMCVNYSTLGSCQELRNDILAAAVEKALFADGEQIRTRAEFIARAENGWRSLSAAAHEVAAVIDPALEAYQDISRRLAERFPALMQPALADMRDQLSRLIVPNFARVVPAPWLPHLPRFLNALLVRTRKLTNAGLARDRAAMEEIAPLWQRYTQAANDEKLRHNPELMTFRWMLEELRVSLFAQELKTSVPVSPKRLEQLWAQVQARR